MSGRRSLQAAVPYGAHIAPRVVSLRGGGYVVGWRLSGVPGDVVAEAEAAVRHVSLNMLYRSVAAPSIALYHHTFRRHVQSPQPGLMTGDSYPASLDRDLAARLDGDGFIATEHYLSLVYRPMPAKAARVVLRAARRTRDEILADRARDLEALDTITGRIAAGLSAYGPVPLGVIESDDGASRSSLLSLLFRLITGRHQSVRVPASALDYALGGAVEIEPGVSVMRVRYADRTRFCQCIDIGDYPNDAAAGLLDPLLGGNAEMCVTQSFAFLSDEAAAGQMKRSERVLRSLGDDGRDRLDELYEARRALRANEFAMGEYGFGALVWGESVEAARDAGRDAAEALRSKGFIPRIVSNALDASYLAHLPGNLSYRPRTARLTTHNFAALAPMHATLEGRAKRNAWGPAITRFVTPSGAPVNFSFHAPGDGASDIGRQPPGNTVLMGQTGTGKSVVLNALWMQALRVARLRVMLLDVDRGARLAVLAAGGDYHGIHPGVGTGINAMDLPPTEWSIDFLSRFVGRLARGDEGAPLTVDEERRISGAVRTVMLELPPELRRLSSVLGQIAPGRGDDLNALIRRLDRWCGEDSDGMPGELSWCFDDGSPRSIGHGRITAFDATAALDHPLVRTPLAMYLTHLFESQLDGSPTILAMDELQRWISDEAFRDFAGDGMERIRKKNGVCLFAAPTPAAVLASPIARKLVEQTVTGIYLGNPAAVAEDYVDGLGLDPSEYLAVRSLAPADRAFVLRARYPGTGTVSQVARLDMSGLDDHLAILSGSTANNAIADAVLADVGTDPDVWLPEFHRRRRARDAALMESA